MVSILKTDKIQASHGSTIEIPAGHVLNAPGHVIQTAQQVYTTQTNITATSFTSTGLTTSITPTSASSKILVISSLSAEVYQNGNSGYSIVFEIKRDSTQISKRYANAYAKEASNGYYAFPIDGAMNFLDSPNTTSSITYSVNAYITNSGSSFTIRLNNQTGTSTLTLQEIAQ